MEPTKPPKSLPPADGHPAAVAPVAALERPANLKKWAAELCQIIEKEKSGIFEGWDFRPGALTRVDLTRILKKISGCGSVVELRAALNRNTGEMGDPVIHAANFCGQHTVCPYCAGRVQDRRGARFKDPIQAMARKYRYAYMVTATIPPVETWREDLSMLIEGWQSFRRMGQVRRRKKKDGTVVESRSGGEWGKVKAGVAKIELKRGDGSGLPHCHYHALVFADEALNYRVWSESEKHKAKEDRTPLYRIPSTTDPRGWVPGSKITFEWWKATDGRAMNLRLDPIKYKPEHKKRGLSFAESVFEQSREVLKYATKFDSSPKAGSEKLFARDFVGIRDATYNRRLFVAYGDFRKVGGDDFEGGGPHISEQPAIFESRWRKNHYSPLVERTKPIFPNTDATPGASARLRALNRLQGGVRRIRSAVVAAKNHFMATGELLPVVYMRREYLEDGGFNDYPVNLEPPAAVASSPRDPAVWENWLDEMMDIGRNRYAQLRDTLAGDSLENLDGTPEERRAAEYREWITGVRAEREAADYYDKVTAAFMEVLNSPDKMISPYPRKPLHLPDASIPGPRGGAPVPLDAEPLAW